jgi:hypothetical protein
MAATAVSPPTEDCTRAERVTKSLLGYGVLAGIVFTVSVLVQGLTRQGFHIAHDDASLLSNGPLGWIQVATFVLAGAMTLVAATGARRAMTGHAGATWGPRLLAVYGAGLVAAGLLTADPADGFGPGAPAGKAAHVSWHGDGHLIAASIAFAALIACCFVIARYFSHASQRGLAVYSRVTGAAFAAAFAGVTTGSSSSAIVLPFYAAVLAAFTWLAIVSVHLYRRTTR